MKATVLSRVLVIWEEIPEETRFYLLDLAGNDLKKVLKAHGQIIGTTELEGDEVNFLGDMLEKAKPCPGDKAFDVAKEEIKYVVHAGFML
jgi:hypothetical protein